MGQAANGLLSRNKDLAAQWTNQMSGWNNCRREKVQENSRLNVTANRAERVSGTQGVRPITKILTRKSENVYPVLQVFSRRSRAVWNRILSTRIGFSPTRNQWIRSPKARRFETVPQSSLRPHPHEPGKKICGFRNVRISVDVAKTYCFVDVLVAVDVVVAWAPEWQNQRPRPWHNERKQGLCFRNLFA